LVDPLCHIAVVVGTGGLFNENPPNGVAENDELQGSAGSRGAVEALRMMRDSRDVQVRETTPLT
jgi:hypothetical protein